MPFLLRATPRQDLAGQSVRPEANLTAAGHSGDSPDQTLDATKHRPVVAPHPPSGQSGRTVGAGSAGDASVTHAYPSRVGAERRGGGSNLRRAGGTRGLGVLMRLNRSAVALACVTGLVMVGGVVTAAQGSV